MCTNFFCEKKEMEITCKSNERIILYICSTIAEGSTIRVAHKAEIRAIQTDKI
jgi:hypothetical protein